MICNMIVLSNDMNVHLFKMHLHVAQKNGIFLYFEILRT